MVRHILGLWIEGILNERVTEESRIHQIDPRIGEVLGTSTLIQQLACWAASQGALSKLCRRDAHPSLVQLPTMIAVKFRSPLE